MRWDDRMYDVFLTFYKELSEDTRLTPRLRESFQLLHDESCRQLMIQDNARGAYLINLMRDAMNAYRRCAQDTPIGPREKAAIEAGCFGSSTEEARKLLAAGAVK